MSDPVQVSVRSSLQSIIDELEKVKKAAKEVQETFEDTGKGVEDGLKDNTKKVDTFFGSLRSLSRRVADQLRGDFKSLVAINAVSDSLKLSNQFKGSITETVTLSDKVRKLGTTFGIAKDQFSSFQSFITSGLGDIGMSSDVASRTLDGLSKTRVRGKENILAYSAEAGMLASISQESGKEGQIAKGLADVTQARGGNVNDQAQLGALSESLRKVFVSTGQTPTESIDAMKKIFTAMPKDLRAKIGSEGLANLATVGAVGGPNATKYFEQYAAMSPIKRMALDAQGGGNLFSDKGIDLDKLASFIDSVSARTGGDPRMGLTTAGIDEDAAEGLVKLRESLDEVRKALQAGKGIQGTREDQYRDTKGLSEAFKANFNQFKKLIATPLAAITQGATDALSATSESTAGSAAVVAGGGLLAALLAGKGLKGVGKGMGIGGLATTAAKTAGAEAVLGEKTIPVYVTNASEIGGGGIGDALGAAGGAAGAAGGAAAMAKNAGMVGLAALVGVGIGKIIEPYVNGALENTEKQNYGGMEMNLGDRIGYVMDKMIGGDMSKELDQKEYNRKYGGKVDGVPAKKLVPTDKIQENKETIREKTVKETTSVVQPTNNPFGGNATRIVIETKEPNLKARTKSPSQGASN